MGAPTSESLALLRSIDATLKALLVFFQNGAAAVGPNVASDHDLDGKFGDEEVRFNPRDWTGEPRLKGLRMSQCPAEALDMLADAYASFARKNEKAGAVTDQGKPKAEFDRRSEARARGWAARVRAGKVPAPSCDPGAEPSAADDWDRSDVGF